VHPHITVSDVRTLRDLPDKLLYPRADVVFVGLQSVKKYVWSTSLTNGDVLGNKPPVVQMWKGYQHILVGHQSLTVSPDQ